MAQFEIGDDVFKSQRLPAMVEFHVTRRLAPVIKGMLPKLMDAVAKGGGKVSLKDLDPKEVSEIANSFIDFVAAMPDKDANFVVSECCMVTDIKKGESWTRVWSRGAQRPQFDDIRFPTMILIVFHVVKEATIDFQPSLGLSSSAEGENSTSTP